MIEDLRKFLDILRREKEIVEISTPVDPYLEAAEIHRRVIDSAGPALLFTNIKGAAFPLVTNLFGTQRRMDLAFGSRPERIVQEAARLPETLFPPSLGKLWEHRSLLSDLAKVGMKRRSQGAVTENIDTPARLTRLPLLTTWEDDGGPFITLPLVYTEHPETRIPNLGMYRMQRFDDDS
ncbi:MAG: UbiD family decarboxylase, partial [Deltaproteobacteria bacterium]|nr:UbiD family decarboxylase [Deltaproteobacteria bacterium]